ncbi:hypothetical protein D3C84_703460 [compost metagenome]
MVERLAQQLRRTAWIDIFNGHASVQVREARFRLAAVRHFMERFQLELEIHQPVERALRSANDDRLKRSITQRLGDEAAKFLLFNRFQPRRHRQVRDPLPASREISRRPWRPVIDFVHFVCDPYKFPPSN